jgi:hypothetical protein
MLGLIIIVSAILATAATLAILAYKDATAVKL